MKFVRCDRSLLNYDQDIICLLPPPILFRLAKILKVLLGVCCTCIVLDALSSALRVKSMNEVWSIWSIGVGIWRSVGQIQPPRSLVPTLDGTQEPKLVKKLFQIAAISRYCLLVKVCTCNPFDTILVVRESFVIVT